MYRPIPIKRSSKYGNNYWEAYSVKMQRNMRLFSDLEYDHWVLIETDPSVTSFCEQPFEIVHISGGNRAKSIPNMWIKHEDGKEIVTEVKYSTELDPSNPKSSRTLRQIEIQRSWCLGSDFLHEVRTETQIRGNRIYLDNMKLMLPYLQRLQCKNEIDEYLIKENLRKSTVKVGDLYLLLDHLGKSRINESLFKMVYQRKLGVELTATPFGIETEVWLI